MLFNKAEALEEIENDPDVYYYGPSVVFNDDGESARMFYVMRDYGTGEYGIVLNAFLAFVALFGYIDAEEAVIDSNCFAWSCNSTEDHRWSHSGHRKVFAGTKEEMIDFVSSGDFENTIVRVARLYRYDIDFRERSCYNNDLISLLR